MLPTIQDGCDHGWRPRFRSLQENERSRWLGVPVVDVAAISAGLPWLGRRLGRSAGNPSRQGRHACSINEGVDTPLQGIRSPASYELFNQIWLSLALQDSLSESWIDRRTRNSGDGSDHDQPGSFLTCNRQLSDRREQTWQKARRVYHHVGSS